MCTTSITKRLQVAELKFLQTRIDFWENVEKLQSDYPSELELDNNWIKRKLCDYRRRARDLKNSVERTV